MVTNLIFKKRKPHIKRQIALQKAQRMREWNAFNSEFASFSDQKSGEVVVRPQTPTFSEDELHWDSLFIDVKAEVRDSIAQGMPSKWFCPIDDENELVFETLSDPHHMRTRFNDEKPRMAIARAVVTKSYGLTTRALHSFSMKSEWAWTRIEDFTQDTTHAFLSPEFINECFPTNLESRGSNSTFRIDPFFVQARGRMYTPFLQNRLLLRKPDNAVHSTQDHALQIENTAGIETQGGQVKYRKGISHFLQAACFRKKVPGMECVTWMQHVACLEIENSKGEVLCNKQAWYSLILPVVTLTGNPNSSAGYLRMDTLTIMASMGASSPNLGGRQLKQMSRRKTAGSVERIDSVATKGNDTFLDGDPSSYCYRTFCPQCFQPDSSKVMKNATEIRSLIKKALMSKRADQECYLPWLWFGDFSENYYEQLVLDIDRKYKGWLTKNNVVINTKLFTTECKLMTEKRGYFMYTLRGTSEGKGVKPPSGYIWVPRRGLEEFRIRIAEFTARDAKRVNCKAAQKKIRSKLGRSSRNKKLEKVRELYRIRLFLKEEFLSDAQMTTGDVTGGTLCVGDHPYRQIDWHRTHGGELRQHIKSKLNFADSFRTLIRKLKTNKVGNAGLGKMY